MWAKNEDRTAFSSSSCLTISAADRPRAIVIVASTGNADDGLVCHQNKSAKRTAAIKTSGIIHSHKKRNPFLFVFIIIVRIHQSVSLKVLRHVWTVRDQELE